MIVDDEPAAREVLTMSLEAAGYVVAAASDGPEALALIVEARPDAILTDIHMPRMDGDELAVCLRQMFADKCPPVVIATADQRVAAQLKEDDRFFAVLEKPLNPNRLLHVIEQAIDSGPN